MACDWAQDNIRVNCVAPGVIVTEMTEPIVTNDSVRKIYEDDTPMGRVGQPNEVAGDSSTDL